MRRVVSCFSLTMRSLAIYLPGTTWYLRMSARAVGSLFKLAMVDCPRAARARLLGANTVNGPEIR